MGLPGSGKTTLAKAICNELLDAGKTVAWFNADVIRKDNDDWDFSPAGRMRQAHRMNGLAKNSTADFVVCDFVCPKTLLRAIFAPHINIWVDTIRDSRFEDTNAIFEPPTNYQFRVLEQDAERYAKKITQSIIKEE